MLRLAQVRQQKCQRSVEDPGDIAVGHAVPQEILRLAQLLIGLAGDSELHFVVFRRERLDLRTQSRMLDYGLNASPFRRCAFGNGRRQGRRV